MGDVSVITAAFNAEDVIERNIRSVAAQSLQPKEHIVIDDGSVDDTVSIAKALQVQFPHLVILEQPRAGAAAARNRGIEAATGRYIAFVDCDDIWSVEKLAVQIEFMERNDVAFSYGDYKAVDQDAGLPLGRYVAPDQVQYTDLLRGCPIGCLTVAFDQEALGKKLMPDVKRGQDWGLWLELTRDGTVGRRYPGCQATYNRSSRSLSSAKFRKLADIYRIYRSQEKLGVLLSVRCLGSHVANAIAKRPVL